MVSLYMVNMHILMVRHILGNIDMPNVMDMVNTHFTMAIHTRENIEIMSVLEEA